MKLTFDQLRPLIKGAAVIEENADGSLLLRRFTNRQQAGCAVADPDYYKCQAAAGCTLDFITDAETLSLTLTGRKKGKRKALILDLLEDGVPSTSQIRWTTPGEDKNAIIPYGTQTFLFPLKKGEKRVTVQFNNFCTVDALTVALPDGASVRPYPHKRKLIAFGDSITQGHSAVYPSRSYMAQLGRMLDAEVFNFGISGERFQEQKIAAGTYPRCDLVTIAYGTNDFGHRAASEELFARNMPGFMQKAAEEFKNIPVFVLLPLWCADEDTIHNSVGSLQSVRARIAAEAEKYGFHVIDCQDFIPHDPAFFADLRLHPNDKGMDAYAENVYKAIREIINV